MRHLRSIFAVAGLAAAGSAIAAPAAPSVPPAPDATALVCSTLPACEARLRAVAASSPNGGAGPDADRVAEAFRHLGAAAWPRVVALSVDRDPKVRNIAGYVMGEWMPLSDAQVPAIAAALRLHPGGWPSRALGTLGTPAAVAVLIDDLKRSGSGNQSTFALAATMPGSLPAILAALQADPSEKLREGLRDALECRCQASARDAAPSERARQVRAWLVRAAAGPQSGVPARREATGLLLALDDDPSIDLAALRVNLASRDDPLRTKTEQLLRKHGDPSALAGLLRICRHALPDDEGGVAASASEEIDACLDPLAKMGRRAGTAVPMLLERLDHVAAVQRNTILATLGYIGDSRVVPVLVARLQSHDDRDVTASLEALWRLHALEALQPIRNVARTHWFAPVREFASRVASSLVGGPAAPVEEALASDFPRSSLTGTHAFGIPLYRKMAPKACTRWQAGNVVVDQGDTLHPAAPLPAGLRAKAKSAPYALAFGAGALLGIDNGEWGGGIAYMAPDGRLVELSKENVHAIVPRGNGDAFAIVGIAHLMDWGGAVLVLSPSRDGARIVDQRRLPSAPFDVLPAGNGWLVVTASGVAIRVGPDLSLEEARCMKLAD